MGATADNQPALEEVIPMGTEQRGPSPCPGQQGDEHVGEKDQQGKGTEPKADGAFAGAAGGHQDQGGKQRG